MQKRKLGTQGWRFPNRLRTVWGCHGHMDLPDIKESLNVLQRALEVELFFKRIVKFHHVSYRVFWRH